MVGIEPTFVRLRSVNVTGDLHLEWPWERIAPEERHPPQGDPDPIEEFFEYEQISAPASLPSRRALMEMVRPEGVSMISQIEARESRPILFRKRARSSRFVRDPVCNDLL